MKRKIRIMLIGAGILSALFGGSSAFAQVDVFAVITKDKDINITEQIRKTKTITINVFKANTYSGAAEAQALAEQRNFNNAVGRHPNHPSILAYGINRAASSTFAIRSNSGIVGVNQDVGNMVNQGNEAAVALTTGFRTLTNSQAETEQLNTLNRSIHREAFVQFLPNDLSAAMNETVVRNRGIVGYNQNAGNMNNQLNTVAMAVGLGSNLALSEAALGQENTRNSVLDFDVRKSGSITNSINGNAGVVGVNQATGHMNNQASVVSMAVLTSHVTLTTPTP